MIDNLYGGEKTDFGYNDTMFETLIRQSKEEKIRKSQFEQYFEYTDRPMAAKRSRINRNYDLDIYSIEDKPTFNFLMGIFFNFVVNDPLLRYYTVFLEQIDHTSQSLKSLLKSHKTFMQV